MTLLNQIRYTLWGPFTVLLILLTLDKSTFSKTVPYSLILLIPLFSHK